MLGEYEQAHKDDFIETAKQELRAEGVPLSLRPLAIRAAQIARRPGPRDADVVYDLGLPPATTPEPEPEADEDFDPGAPYPDDFPDDHPDLHEYDDEPDED